MEPRRPRRSPLWPACWGLTLLAAASCTSFLQPGVSQSVAASSREAWAPAAAESTPPVEGVPSTVSTTRDFSARVADSKSPPTLPELIAIALENNPQTRSAYYQARAAAAGVGIARA